MEDDSGVTRTFEEGTHGVMEAVSFEMDVASAPGTVSMTDVLRHICYPAYVICQPSVHAQSETLLDDCYTDNIVGVRVTNPTTNSWAGAIEYSSDGGATYAALECRGCTGSTATSARIVVDGGTHGGAQATTQCLDRAICDLHATWGWPPLSPPPPLLPRPPSSPPSPPPPLPPPLPPPPPPSPPPIVSCLRIITASSGAADGCRS